MNIENEIEKVMTEYDKEIRKIVTDYMVAKSKLESKIVIRIKNDIESGKIK